MDTPVISNLDSCSVASLLEARDMIANEIERRRAELEQQRALLGSGKRNRKPRIDAGKPRKPRTPKSSTVSPD